jgi:acyl carrier protein
MEMRITDTPDRVLAVVRSILDENAIRAEVGPYSLLMDIGLTSVDMVTLMLKVEAEFDLIIPQFEITPENFQSVEALARMIDGHTGVKASASAGSEGVFCSEAAS